MQNGLNALQKEGNYLDTVTQIREQICDVCHKMWQLGWVAANDGNVSALLDDGTILTTPTGMSKSFITPDKLIRVDRQGNVLEAAEGLRPSSELKCIFGAMTSGRMYAVLSTPIPPERRGLQ